MIPILVKNTIGHTTSSIPRPHIVYKFQVDCDGVVDILNKRYSEFATLHATLGITDFQLPPKRLLVTTFIPSAWVDDALISERKAGLEEYLSSLLQVPEYRHSDTVQEFLQEYIQPSPREFELEDVLPSTLTKKAADELLNAASSPIAASYYASWSNVAPEKIDYSKFDILFFGAICDTQLLRYTDVPFPSDHLRMNYDINGDWSSAPGPNAPLVNHCGNSSQPAYTAEAAFLQWTKAGFPASKLLLGLPLYSYVLHSSKTTLSEMALPGIEEDSLDEEVVGPVRGANKTPTSAEASDETKSEITTEATANLSKYWGQQVAFKTLVSSGALVKKAEREYDAGGGFKRVWDRCSNTPFLYNTAQQTVVPYDDTLSLADKAAFAKAKGMAGCFTWSMDQDDGVTLQNAIRKALGK